MGKEADPSCECGHPSQSGDHLVFHCPRLDPQRRRLLGSGVSTWEDLDTPHWITEAGGEGREQEKVEGIEAFFQDLYWEMKRGSEGRQDGEV